MLIWGILQDKGNTDDNKHAVDKQKIIYVMRKTPKYLEKHYYES